MYFGDLREKRAERWYVAIPSPAELSGTSSSFLPPSPLSPSRTLPVPQSDGFLPLVIFHLSACLPTYLLPPGRPLDGGREEARRRWFDSRLAAWRGDAVHGF